MMDVRMDAQKKELYKRQMQLYIEAAKKQRNVEKDCVLTEELLTDKKE